MRTLYLSLLLAGTASAAAQTGPDARSPEDVADALAARALRQSDGPCGQAVPMPTLDLDATPAPVPMPEVPLVGTPAPMPNLCDGLLADRGRESGVFPITPEFLDNLRDRMPPEARERLWESLDGVRERLERAPDASGRPVPAVPLAPPDRRR